MKQVLQRIFDFDLTFFHLQLLVVKQFEHFRFFAAVDLTFGIFVGVGLAGAIVGGVVDGVGSTEEDPD